MVVILNQIRELLTLQRRRVIKFILPGIIIGGLAFIGSCEEYLGPTVNCDECYYEKPDSADLIIHLTINNEHPEVPIVLYRGNIEDREVDWVGTARETPYYLYSRVNQMYSVEATYKAGERTIIAVDADAIKVKHVSEGCNYECWVVTGGILKAELKFD